MESGTTAKSIFWSWGPFSHFPRATRLLRGISANLVERFGLGSLASLPSSLTISSSGFRGKTKWAGAGRLRKSDQSSSSSLVKCGDVTGGVGASVDLSVADESPASCVEDRILSVDAVIAVE